MDPESEETKPPSDVGRARPRRWIRRILVAIAIPPLVLLVFLLAEHLRGHIALARYVRAMRAQGEKMSPREFLLPVAPGENGAPEISGSRKGAEARPSPSKDVSPANAVDAVRECRHRLP